MEKKRIVVKVGTSTLTHENGKINIRQMEKLVRVVSELVNCGNEVVLVSSGAVGAGVGKLALPNKPEEIRKKQALAAIGQASLMSTYDRFSQNMDTMLPRFFLQNMFLTMSRNIITPKTPL